MEELKIDPKKVAKKLIKFIAEEVNKTGYKKAVLGLSGGVDSATTACLGQEALGKKNVFGIIMPHQALKSEDIRDAENLTRSLRINCRVISIEPALKGFKKIFSKIDHIRQGNIMARLRMIVLYDFSKTLEALVLGNSNKSEWMLGYATIYGDMACALNPLGNLYKTQVWQLAQYLGIPKTIISKPPSAGLWPGQTDEQELGLRYKELDPLLYYMVDLGYDDDKLIELGFKQETISKIKGKIKSSGFKRKMPLVAEIKVT
ncbi:MAG: NAD+ synthase [Candidatus Omnitrophota bacterium]|nr:NAD+ synthase [Candidatus Omnitrophota bacterium]